MSLFFHALDNDQTVNDTWGYRNISIDNEMYLYTAYTQLFTAYCATYNRIHAAHIMTMFTSTQSQLIVVAI